MKTKRLVLKVIVAIATVFLLHPQIYSKETIALSNPAPTSADRYWGQYHGPADGCARLQQGPGPDIELAWSLNLMDRNNDGHPSDDLGYYVLAALNAQTLVRADDSYLYFDPAYFYNYGGRVCKLDPSNGNLLNRRLEQAGQSGINPEGFQLYDSPQGYRAIFRSSFNCGAYILNVNDFTSQPLLVEQHSGRGSRILMGGWAWHSTDLAGGCPSGSVLGRLKWWNGSGYVYTSQMPSLLEIYEAAWDEEKCVVMVNVQGVGPRWLVLNREGQIIKNVPTQGIYISRFAVKGDYIYEGEYTMGVPRMVRRSISSDFSMGSSVVLEVGASQFCIDDNAVYVQDNLKIKAYSLDLSHLLWQKDMPAESRGISQTIACDGNYVYHSAKDRLQVRRAQDGEVVYEYIFTDFPYCGGLGYAGDIVLIPNYIIVVSYSNYSHLWCFKKNPAPGSAPVIIDPEYAEGSAEPVKQVAYIDNPFTFQMRIASGKGPYAWSIDSTAQTLIEKGLKIDQFGKISGWTPTMNEYGITYTISVTLTGAFGSDTKSFQVQVQNEPARQLLVDFGSNPADDVCGVAGLTTPFNVSTMSRTADSPGGLVLGQHIMRDNGGVKGAGRYFFPGERIEARLYNRSLSGPAVTFQPQLSFLSEGSYDTCPVSTIPIGTIISLPSQSYATISYTLKETDKGFHKLVNIFPGRQTGNGADIIFDKIELVGALSAERLPPIVDAGQAQAITLPVSSVILTGSARGVTPIVSYRWEKVSGSSGAIISSPNSVSTSVGNLRAGDYVFRLTATDSTGISASDEVNVIVNTAVGEGLVFGWGINGGQLGDGTTDPTSLNPKRVLNVSQVKAVSVGTQNLALTQEGTVWGWGSVLAGSWVGQTIPQPTPALISGLDGIIAIASGDGHNLVLKNDGTIKAWGINWFGQLGDGTTTQSISPIQISSLSNVIAIAAGNSHSLALKNDGAVWAWGYNSAGQLGDATTTQKTSPVQVSGLSDVIAIVAGTNYSLALKNDNTVWAWGSNAYGQLGDGTTTQKTSPVQVSGLNNVVAIAAGSLHSLGVTRDGKVWIWGYILSDSRRWISQLTPVQVSALDGIVAIAAGSHYNVALKNDGTTWAWGSNEVGQLGDGTTTPRVTPIQIQSLPTAKFIAANRWCSFAVIGPMGNQAPHVNAGQDVVANVTAFPASVTLSATVTDDGLPNPPGIVTTLWEKVSGPGTVTFVDAQKVNTTVSFSGEGTYILRLTANDSESSTSDEVSITVSISSFVLNIITSNGSVTKNPDQPTYAHGTVVTLTAVPNSGYQFSSWSGALSGSQNPATIAMDSDKSVTANFMAIPVIPRAILTLSKSSPVSGDAHFGLTVTGIEFSDIQSIRVELRIDNKSAAWAPRIPYTFSYKTNFLTNGKHTAFCNVIASLRSRGIQSFVSNTIVFSVDNKVSYIPKIIKPGRGALVYLPTIVQMRNNAPVAPDSVVFYLDYISASSRGFVLGSTRRVPYQIMLVPSKYKEGVHFLTCVARYTIGGRSYEVMTPNVVIRISRRGG